jgi:type II secretory pathway pseudopilin PulG
MNGTEKGVSLIEVVLVVVLGMLLAGAVVPKLLDSRVAANEAAAVANVNLITSAQETYRSAYPNLGYADALARLATICGQAKCDATPEHACLIDCTLPKATATTKDGYYYGLSADGEGATLPHKVYVVVATTPIRRKTGDHNFCAIEDAKIRFEAVTISKPLESITRSACRALPVLP